MFRLPSHAAPACPHAVSEYEKMAYYNGVTRGGDNPFLVYRSDYAVNPFPIPQGRFRYPPVKAVQEVYRTSLNPIWHTVGPQVRDIVKTMGVRPFSVDPARFARYEDDNSKTLGPPVVWVGVPPNSTTPDTAHDVSKRILALLTHHGAQDVVVEWREVVLSKLSGPPLMRSVNSYDATAHVRRPFTTALNIPLATKEMEAEVSQGSLTLVFHESEDRRGEPSKRVLGVTNCHVLRKDTTVDYRFGGAGTKQLVQANSAHRFQKALDDIKSHIRGCAVVADYHARAIDALEAKNTGCDEDNKLKERHSLDLAKGQQGMATLETFYTEVENQWGNAQDRTIGHVVFAKAITVDAKGGTYYTEDWGAFDLDESKFRANFEGTVVDLGTKMAIDIIRAMFYPRNNPRGFEHPGLSRKLQIEGLLSPELLANPDLVDDKGRPCLIVGKDGSETGLTFGRYAGLESFLCDDLGVDSIELGFYNWGRDCPPFVAKGDSGALVWDGRGRAVGQLHSGSSKGGSSRFHVAYATPASWLVERIKLEFPHAVFFSTTWPT